ncbi:SURF1 family protein [Rhodoferax sp.]|uniref:SURF1 family protein n=1 Tax=Rhodoferax sp. TaxID=50421 RepID=UPI00374DAB9B
MSLQPDTAAARGRGPRAALLLAAFALCAAFLFAGFVALGTWQVQRRAWKLDLIARVEQRVHASPTAAPPPSQWPQINAASDEYRHVFVSGIFLHDKETLVQASTTLGAGFWVMTPLQLSDGSAILVNRGFVPPEARDGTTRRATEVPGTATVSGLIRMSEPNGGFLRHNDSAKHRWYSRDVQAIARDVGLPQVVPYFLDADAAAPGSEPTDSPVGGLTVVSFHNSHVVYALTWYALALMVAGGAAYVLRLEWRLRHPAA